MKKVVFLFLFIYCKSFSQSFFIIKNDSSKVLIKSNYFRIDALEKNIYYKSLVSDKESKMSFKEFDYAELGINRFKTFKLNNSNAILGFFVLVETSDKLLISISKKEESEDSDLTYYVFHVIDKQNTIIESYNFNDSKNTKNVALRADIYYKLRFYFSNCPVLIDRISRFDKNAVQSNQTSILGFFNTPIYINCI